MLCARWRFWLAALLLAALPLKAWAALGLIGCCPPGQHHALSPAVAAHAAHVPDLDGRAHPASAATAHSAQAQQAPSSADHAAADAPAASLSHAHAAGGGADKASPPCCGAAAITASAWGLGVVSPVGTSVDMTAPLRYRSAHLAAPDKPPRT